MRARLAAVLLALVALTACGREPLDPPRADRPAAAGLERTRAAFPAAGVAFRAPKGWEVETGMAPLVARAASGTASVAVWRYPRTEPLPADDDALRQARRRLADAARTRDPGFRLLEDRLVRTAGARGVQLVGRQTVAGAPRRVRSTHLFANGAEVVVDAFAAPRDFRRADRRVFAPLLRSLRLSAPSP